MRRMLAWRDGSGAFLVCTVVVLIAALVVAELWFPDKIWLFLVVPMMMFLTLVVRLIKNGQETRGKR